MDESLLHHIWKLQRYDSSTLTTSDGMVLQIVHPGMYSTDAGPDFMAARLRIGDVHWTGNVEIHVDSRDWFTHRHHEDPAYDNVILHVVWQHKGRATLRTDGTEIPLLELKGRVDDEVLLKYSRLSQKETDIPCNTMLAEVPDIVRLDMVDHAMAGRLERKAQMIAEAVRKANNHWEEASYRLLAANFGFKINGAPFAQLARSVPLEVVQRNADSLERLEAILFGVAGFLAEDPADDYQAYLLQQYQTYSLKYGLHRSEMQKKVWKFSRMRPAGFPTVRIAQFAACMAKTPNLFSTLLSAGTPAKVRDLFSVRPTHYWSMHYDFGKSSGKLPIGLGTEAINNIIINTIVPLLGGYGILQGDQERLDQATALLASVKPENNKIIRRWHALGLKARNAAETQGLIEMYNEYCARKRCANCKIGTRILNAD